MTARVFSPMSHHRGALRKGFVANITNVRSLTSVSEFVDSESVRAGKGLGAHVACVWAFASVHAIVHSE